MPKILVIDDESRVRKTLRMALERRGYEVAEAENGRSGLRLLRSENFDLIITDILMPDMEGIETIRELRKAGSATKILAMSGGGRWNNTECLSAAKAFGADATLAKPFGLEELFDQVTALCT